MFKNCSENSEKWKRMRRNWPLTLDVKTYHKARIWLCIDNRWMEGKKCTKTHVSDILSSSQIPEIIKGAI